MEVLKVIFSHVLVVLMCKMWCGVFHYRTKQANASFFLNDFNLLTLFLLYALPLAICLSLSLSYHLSAWILSLSVCLSFSLLVWLSSCSLAVNPPEVSVISSLFLSHRLVLCKSAPPLSFSSFSSVEPRHAHTYPQICTNELLKEMHMNRHAQNTEK